MEQSLQTAVGKVSYIHFAKDYRYSCRVGDQLDNCQLGLFQDASDAGDLQLFKSTSSGVLCKKGDRTFVSISWMCQKATAASHSSTKAEVICLDAGLRMEGLTACAVDVL